MTYLAGIVLPILYLITVVFTTAYCVYNFILTLLLKSKKSRPSTPIPKAKVTIQLPVYNEKNVIEQLYEHIDQLSYPNELLEIQILDDSTDETLEISKKWESRWKKAGKEVSLIHRKDRAGYKAGALALGLTVAKGEYICIFDADFRPCPPFIEQLLPSFGDLKIAVVQARWSYTNPGQNLLTQLQTLQLNIHFAVEQRARYLNNLPLQFNGTCGIWRKSAILSAGGWQDDTLTEDLDLSYRAQLQGWKIIYQDEVSVPGELPDNLESLKIQQHRWMKGGAETARKLIRNIWGSKFSFIQKLSSTLHLLASSVYLCMFAMALVTIPLSFLNQSKSAFSIDESLSYFPLLLFTTTMIIANINSNASIYTQLRDALKHLLMLPLFIAFHLGFSYHNSKAAVGGWRGIRTAFKRTPKTGNSAPENAKVKKKKTSISDNIVELVLGLIFMSCCFYHGTASAFYHFHILCATGFLSIFVLSLIQTNMYHEN